MAANDDTSDLNAKVPSQSEVTAEQVAVAKQQLREAIHGSNEILATATTVFPLTLFPHTITVDRAKLTITHRIFFAVADLMSIRIEDILNVTAHVGPIFGSVHITSRVMSPDKPFEVNFLFRDDALRLKRIMQGYIIAIQKEIDVTPLKTKELAAMLDRLGQDTHGR